MSTMTLPARTLVLVLAPLLALACAGSSVRREAADVLLPPSQEAQLGQQVRGEILKKEKVLQDEQVQNYVQALGNRLVALDRAALPPGITPKFTVLDSPQVNAFAIPGGDIFVYSGLLKMVDSEAELASVLAHELGHVSQRHIAQAMVTQYGLEALTSIALGQNANQLAQIGAAVASNGYMLTYSRENEREADHVGMATLLRAHDWDPHAMIRFFTALGKESGNPSGIAAFLSNHPPPADRAQYLTAQLQQAGNPGGNEHREELAAIQQRLPARAATQPGAPKG